MKKVEQRPVLKLPLTNLEKVLELLAGIGVLLSIAFIIAKWNVIPAEVPSHFGPSGMPDDWSGKETLIFLVVLNLLLYLALTIVCRFPHIYNYPWKITAENAQDQYQIARYLMVFLKTEIVWLLLYIESIAMLVSLGIVEGMGKAFLPVFLVIIFGSLGAYFYLARKHK